MTIRADCFRAAVAGAAGRGFVGALACGACGARPSAGVAAAPSATCSGGAASAPSAAPDARKAPAYVHRPATSSLPLAFVDPMIGTAQAPGWEYGGTIPAVTRPFGMTQWTAMTRRNRISVCPYHHDDDTIRGFLGTHQPAVWMGDYGYVSITPGFGELALDARYPFDHATEISSPNLYAVDLRARGGTIRAEATATERAGFFRFTFPRGAAPWIVLEGTHSDTFVGWVKVDPAAREIVGYNPDRQSAHLGPALKNFKGWFVARFDRPFASYGTWDNVGIPRTSRTEESTVHVGAYATFAADPAGAPLSVQIGTSFIDLDQARKNLEREIGAATFDETAKAGEEAWSTALRAIEVRGGTPAEKTIFYTALFHALLFPRQFAEYGRYYSAFDDRVHNGVAYDDYSLWDTFRAEHPLLLLVAPKRAVEMVSSLVQAAREGGRLPIWPNPAETNIMISTHAECVIADAFVKGMRGYDVRAGYAAAHREATVPPDGDARLRWQDRLPWTGPPAPPGGRGYEGRGGLTTYAKLGYVASDRTEESVSRTVEFGVDDYCTAQVARELAPADYAPLMKRAASYRNLYNPATGLLQAKRSDGSFDPSPTDGFTEGDPWTYLFGAMHDVPGTIAMLGGRERFVAKLDANFEGGHYRHDNEPGHHYPYLYDWAGAAYKTQERVRRILATDYDDSPSGLVGNDDCGQMSAWYVFSAMGLYPVTPASGVYALGSPLFDEVTVHLEPPAGHGTLTVRAKNQSAANVYVQSATLDGVPLPTPFVRHADLVRGGAVLELTMGPKPNTSLWSAPGGD